MFVTMCLTTVGGIVLYAITIAIAQSGQANQQNADTNTEQSFKE